MLTMTDKAIKAVKRFVRFSEQPFGGLRVGVTSGGCSGFQYEIEMAQEAGPEDQVVDISGIKVFIDPASARMIDGLTIDFKETLTESGFVFDNPNASGSCGCGKSFQA